MPPNMERDIETYNRLKKEDPKKAMAFIIEWMKTPEAQEAFGHLAKVKFPEEQRAWFKKVLAENTDVRWTFVFLHKPVWDNPSDDFKEIDQAIQGRDYTFFAGHTHYYDYDLINGHEYITVGSAGAAFVHDGPGNVDMLTLVTMTEDGPEIAGIALKGIFDCKGLDPKAANAELGGGKVEAGFRKSYREFVSLPSAQRGFRKFFLALGDKAQLPALFHSAILGVKKEYLEAAFHEMKTKYDTIENYFSKGLGIDAAQQKAIRDLYLTR